MDLSKLPRMSKTPTPPPPAVPAVGAVPDQKPPTGDKSGASCPSCAAALRGGARFCDNCGSPIRTASEPGAGMMAEAWISVGIGILLLIICPTMTKYVSSKIFHTHFAPYDAVDADGNLLNDKDGKPVKSDVVTMQPLNTKIPYRQTTPDISPNFWNDLAITSFALALIIEGVALVLSSRPIVVAFALIITVAATLLNMAYLIGTFGKYGIAPISALAGIFGIYMAIYQFGLFQAVRRK